MKEYKCHVAQKGFYAGPVHKLAAPASDIKKISADPAEETAKLETAIAAIKQSLSAASGSQGASASAQKNAEIMETVSMMLDDDAFIGEIRQCISDEGCNAEYAVKTKSSEYAKKMENADSEYLRARASDITGVGEQLISVMSGNADSGLTVLSALVAPDISPAQMTSFDSKLVGGIITDKGSPNSHLSILAGNLEIPYIYGNAEAVAAAADAVYIIIDEDKLTINPDEDAKSEANARMLKLSEEKKQRAESEKDAVCKTKIYANIAGPKDIPQLLESGADGVGLFRSEFLFLGKDAAPSEEEQYQAYKSVLEAMGDKEVIIRTMDLGSDKKVSWLAIPDEPNPALGLRGARVSLEKKEIFNTQLRALLRAGACGNLKVMFPMIASQWEIDEIAECVNAAAAELEKEKLEYKLPELGIMVETPAAVITADILSKSDKVSFFSIGTNDLTQYTLALDRESQGLDRYFNPHHEAVLRLIETTAREGHRNNVTTGICGQLAADPEVTERLIAAGVDELSVPISKVRQTRANAAKAEAAIAASAAATADQAAAPATQQTAEAPAPASKPAAPADGALIPMNEIPDTVFSSGQLGKCIGILPDNGNIYSPCDGTIVSIAETKHAVTIHSDEGEDYLVHVGIDTVKLAGKGFEVLVAEGDRVSRSQQLMKADLATITQAGYSTMVILVKL